MDISQRKSMISVYAEDLKVYEMNILKGGGQKDGGDPVFSGGAGKLGEEVQETGENLRKILG